MHPTAARYLGCMSRPVSPSYTSKNCQRHADKRIHERLHDESGSTLRLINPSTGARTDTSCRLSCAMSRTAWLAKWHRLRHNCCHTAESDRSRSRKVLRFQCVEGGAPIPTVADRVQLDVHASIGAPDQASPPPTFLTPMLGAVRWPLR